MIVVCEDACTRIDVRRRHVVMLQNHREQRGAESFAIRRDFILRSEVCAATGSESKNLAFAVFDQVAKFLLLFGVQNLRDLQMTFEMFFKIYYAADQRVRYATHRRHNHYNRRVVISTHDLHGALESGCVGDGSAAEFEDFNI